MRTDRSIIYHIYPLGFCAVEPRNGFASEPVNRISKISGWLPHIQSLGCDTLLLGPVWESSAHGYDTADFLRLDRRLGSNDDFRAVAEAVHAAGMNLVLDGVFNHVGRDFWAFRDVVEKRENSPYKDWFTVNFSLNNGFNDGLCYHAWEGCEDLVTLNLANPEVRRCLLDAVRFWIEAFGIDGLRLDVAYCLNMDFMRELRDLTAGLKPGFWLLGEVIKANYRRWLRPGLVDSVTNYECWKGLWSSCNTHNMFEIAHSFDRQFGEDGPGIYRGWPLYNFADNHDVSRLASKLKDSRHLPIVYTLLYTMPGIPSLYYGSEWGAEGKKEHGSDDSLRPCFEAPQCNALTEWIATCAKAHKESKALCYGDFKSLMLTNKQLIFERSFEGQRVLVAVNADGEAYDAHFNANAGRARDLLTGQTHDFGGGSKLPPYSAAYWEIY